MAGGGGGKYPKRDDDKKNWTKGKQKNKKLLNKRIENLEIFEVLAPNCTCLSKKGGLSYQKEWFEKYTIVESHIILINWYNLLRGKIRS